MHWAITLVGTLILTSTVAAGDSELPDLSVHFWAPLTTPGIPHYLGFNAQVACGETGVLGFEVDLHIDGSFFERIAVDDLMPPCSGYGGFASTRVAFEGYHEFTAIIDPRSLVAEADETNNQHSVARIFSNLSPDLSVGPVRVTQVRWPLAQVRFESDLCNVGSATHYNTFELAVMIRDRPDQWWRVIDNHSEAVLQAGECRTFEETYEIWPTLQGSPDGRPDLGLGQYEYRIRIEQDYADPARDLNESNDGRTGEFEIGPQVPP